MSKLPDKADAPTTPEDPADNLRAGWAWAPGSKMEEAKQAWRDMGPKMRAKFLVQQQYVEKGAFEGVRVSHWICYESGGVGKMKVTHPSPGVRGWYYRDGRTHYMTHFTSKGDEDHEQEMKRTQNIRDAHLSSKSVKKRK